METVARNFCLTTKHMKTLPTLSEDAKAALHCVTSGGDYAAHLATLRKKVEDSVKVEFPHLSLTDQVAKARAQYTLVCKELRKELRKFVSAL